MDILPRYKFQKILTRFARQTCAVILFEHAGLDPPGGMQGAVWARCAPDLTISYAGRLPPTRVQQYSCTPRISRTLHPRRPSTAVNRGQLARATGAIPLAATGECPSPSLPPYPSSLCILAWCNARQAERSVLCVCVLPARAMFALRMCCLCGVTTAGKVCHYQTSGICLYFQDSCCVKGDLYSRSGG